MSCRHEAGCLAGTEGWQGLGGFSLKGSSNAAVASQYELQGQLDIQVETLQGKCHYDLAGDLSAKCQAEIDLHACRAAAV